MEIEGMRKRLSSLFCTEPGSEGENIAEEKATEQQQNVNKEYFKIVTFNCKNIETSKYAIQELSKTTDVILLQEHWYFDCQLNKLNAVSEDMIGSGKATDTGDPILPVQMPRGYGGTAVLWQKKTDHSSHLSLTEEIAYSV